MAAITAIVLTGFGNIICAQQKENNSLPVQALSMITVPSKKTGNTPKHKLGERKLSMESLPVTTISGEEIENISYKNKDFTEIIQAVPGIQVDISRQSTINLKGLGTARTLVLIDGKRLQPVYAQLVTYDPNNFPISAVERIEVLKDGGSAIYGSDAVSGVVNFITKQEMQPRITSNNTYDPYYNYPSFDFSGLRNNEYTTWVNNVKDIFSAKLGITTLKDDTYGKGGTLVIDLKDLDDFRVQSMQFRDQQGNVRQWTTYEIYPENYRYGETNYYDCNGSTLHYSSGFTDIHGYNFPLMERAYQNNQPAVEYRDIWPGNNGNRLRLNLNPQQTSNDAFKNYWSNYNFEIPTGQCQNNSTAGCNPNILFGGFSMVFEDFGSNQDRLKMPGGFINYTRMFSQNLGVTGHVSYNAGSRSMVDYRKLNFLAGLSYTPLQNANCDDRFIFTAQALLGVVKQGQKYNNLKFNDSYFTGMFGFTEAFRISDNVAVRVAEHYTPTFGNGNTAHNFTLGLGLRYDFGNLKDNNKNN